jgi:hypothetical protein
VGQGVAGVAQKIEAVKQNRMYTAMVLRNQNSKADQQKLLDAHNDAATQSKNWKMQREAMTASVASMSLPGLSQGGDNARKSINDVLLRAQLPPEVTYETLSNPKQLSDLWGQGKINQSDLNKIRAINDGLVLNLKQGTQPVTTPAMQPQQKAGIQVTPQQPAEEMAPGIMERVGNAWDQRDAGRAWNMLFPSYYKKKPEQNIPAKGTKVSAGASQVDSEPIGSPAIRSGGDYVNDMQYGLTAAMGDPRKNDKGEEFGKAISIADGNAYGYGLGDEAEDLIKRYGNNIDGMINEVMSSGMTDPKNFLSLYPNWEQEIVLPPAIKDEVIQKVYEQYGTQEDYQKYLDLSASKTKILPDIPIGRTAGRRS